jgi:hypothetical protein
VGASILINAPVKGHRFEMVAGDELTVLCSLLNLPEESDDGESSLLGIDRLIS